MKLYEINREIEELIDLETGELLDPAKFIILNMEKDEKIQNMALGYKNLMAESEMISEEIRKLQVRKKSTQNKAKNLKEYIDFILQKESKKFANVKIGYRKNSHIEVDNNFVEWAKTNNTEFLIQKEPDISKNKIKEYLNSGHSLEYARVVETNDIQIR